MSWDMVLMQEENLMKYLLDILLDIGQGIL